jgi:hypothetical protein
MNIAVSSILIFLLLFPGITFRRFYYTEEFSKQYFKRNFFDLFISSILPSIFIHLSLSLIVSILGYQVDFKVLGKLLTADGYSEIVFSNIQSNTIKISIYYLSSLFIGVITGYLSKRVIRYYNIDSRRKFFRYNNSWHYIFTGEFFNFPRASFDLIDDSFKSIEFVYVDALVESSEGTIIYDGILVDYELSSNGGLSNFSLKEVQRRMLKDDEAKKYYNIPGHIMVIPAKSIINLNFSYYKFVEIEGKIGVELVK